MEKAEGVNLNYIIENEEKTTEKDTAKIIEQLLKIVIYLNKNNISHCDIRPNNILINPTNLHLTLIDFGSSNYLLDTIYIRQKVKEPLYAAPEVLANDFDSKCDLWSIGIIAYQLLTGKLPFKSKKKTRLYKEMVKLKLDKNSLNWINRSEEVFDFMSKILNPDAEFRITAKRALKHPWIKLKHRVEEDKLDPVILARICNYHKVSSFNLRKIPNISSINVKSSDHDDCNLIYQILDVIITNCRGKTFKQFDEMFKILDYDGQGYISLKYVEQKLMESHKNELFYEEKSNKLYQNHKIGYSVFLFSCVDWKTHIRIDGIK